MSDSINRALAAICFFVGGVTVIGSVVLWPIGYLLWRQAKQNEAQS